MVKDSLKTMEKPIKRKVTTAQTTEIADGAPPAKQPELDLYNKIINMEEKAAQQRDPQQDAALFFNVCKEIHTLLVEIAQLKTKSSDDNAAELKEKKTLATIKIMHLKELNRLEKMRMKDCRDSLQKYREQVDCDHLHLQNLVYENIHLGKQVKKCYDFKSIDEDMELVSVEEFYATAPASITKEETTKNDPHELKLARLTWELTQRKELAAKVKELESTKESITKGIELAKEQLATIGPHLKTIIDTTKPLQQLLNIPADKMRKMHELALLLPKPLYVLYVQAEAYSQLAKWLSVGIIGKEEEARLPENQYEPIASDSSASDVEDDEDESSHRRKPTKVRRKSAKINEESDTMRKEKCMERHALSVELSVTVSGGVTVTLTFRWLVTLQVVTVTASVTGVSGAEASGVAVADLLASSSLLSAMYPGDTGEVFPNPSSQFHLQWAGLTEIPSDMENVGVAYRWAQTLCGLSFLNDQTAPCASPKISQQNMEGCLKVIRDRLRSRIALAKEVKLLESGEALRDKKLQARILSFTAVTLSDLGKLDSGARLIENNIVDVSYLVYRANIDVHGVKMSAYIALPPTYPSVLPIVCLQVTKLQLTSINNDHVRDIEREINTEITAGGDVLLGQVYALLLCTEVLTGTELSPDRPVVANLFRPVMGRKRSHPLRHLSTAGGIFTHR